MSSPYIFTSERLGFRLWSQDDVQAMAAINADPEVMEFFSSTQDRQRTEGFINRMIGQFEEFGFCYFPVERLDTNELIGFIGLLHQTYEANFTPCVDIGWRLAKKHWGNGFATEGGKRCVAYAFNEIGLPKLVSVCAEVNTKSEAVMKKLGMHKTGTFKHPALKGFDWLETCVLYELENPAVR